MTPHPSVYSNPISDYAPGYDAQPTGRMRVSVDPDGQQKGRTTVLTDEGGYRVNFSGTSLAKAIGTATFVTNSTEVQWSPVAGYDLHRGDYVFLDADGAAFCAQVASFDETSIQLVTPYLGTGGSGNSSRQVVAQRVGTGCTAPVVASGVMTMATGTTSGSVVEIKREVDFLPLGKQCAVAVSQRIANQVIRIGLCENVASPRWFAWFVLDGTSNTTVKTQSARNATGAPSAAETEEQTVTIPNGKTSAVSLRYRVEMFGDKVNFYIENVLVARHVRSLPNATDMLTSVVRAVNTGTAASSTTVTVDFDFCRNFNAVDTAPSSDLSQYTAQEPPADLFSFTQASVVTINTDVLVVDCSQYRTLSIQCASMGTTGVVTPAWSNDGTNWVAATLITPATAAATTITAAGMWVGNVAGRFFRLRMTTATTAGTTTFAVFGFHSATGAYAHPTVDTELPVAAALADAAANPTAPMAGSPGLLFNGTTWDRARGNFAVTTGDTGAKTATGNGATQTNYNARGAILIFVIGAVTGTSPTCVFKIQGSGDGGTTWYDIPGAATASITATGNTVLAIYPGATVATNATVSYPLPRTWRVYWTLGGTTPSFTITGVQVSYIL